jgi:2-polyprenyl-6-hydroxyphenyl methylase/3-demethylubiquinone-9 3-methyltransferase
MSASSGPEHIAGAAKSATVDSASRKFSAADAWWDPAGAFKPLHRLNPVRLAYIRDAATRR